MTTAAHIVVVDDDAALRKRLAAYLKRENFRVSVAAGGAELRRIVEAQKPDLVILDLVMPGEDGLALTQYLRTHGGPGIIILTGKGAAVDRVVGLELGADDYVAKPFELRELLARIRSVLRRLAPPAAAEVPAAARLRFAGWEIDIGARRLRAPDGRDVHLTAAEFDLLACFVRNPMRALSRDRLLDEIDGREWHPFDRSIDLHISHLRHKIEDDPARPRLIATVRGTGYRFGAEVEKT